MAMRYVRPRGVRALAVLTGVLMAVGTLWSMPVRSDATEYAAERERLSRLSSETLFDRGYRYLTAPTSYPDSAMICFLVLNAREEKARGDSVEMDWIIKSLINSSFITSNVYGDYPEAYRLLDHARRLATDYGMDTDLAHIYLNLHVLMNANRHVALGEDLSGDRPLNHFLDEGFKRAVNSGYTKGAAFILFNMLDAVNNPADSASLRSACTTFLKLDVGKNLFASGYLRPMARAVLAFLDKDYPLALQRVDSVVVPRNYDLVNSAAIQAEKEFVRATILEEAGRIDEAESTLLSIAGDTEFMQTTLNRIWVNRLLYLFYTRQGDKAQADRYLLAYYRDKESAASQSTLDPDSALQVQAELGDFRDELKDVQEKKRRDTILMISIIVVSVLTILVLGGALAYQRRRRQYITSLYEKNMELLSTTPPTPETVVEEAVVQETDTPAKAAESGKDTALLASIMEVVENDPVVLSPDFQMSQLADLVGSNTSYVSHAINSLTGKSFKSLLSERRVREACRLMSDPEAMKRYSIEGIAQAVGFKSRAAFSVAFKNVTGLSPTEFRNVAKKRAAQGAQDSEERDSGTVL